MTTGQTCLEGIRNFEDGVEQLIDDSAVLIPLIVSHLPQSDGDVQLVDVGSGAGIPGIIFGILKPEWNVPH